MSNLGDDYHPLGESSQLVRVSNDHFFDHLEGKRCLGDLGSLWSLTT